MSQHHAPSCTCRVCGICREIEREILCSMSESPEVNVPPFIPPSEEAEERKEFRHIDEDNPRQEYIPMPHPNPWPSQHPDDDWRY